MVDLLLIISLVCLMVGLAGLLGCVGGWIVGCLERRFPGRKR